MSGKSKYIMYVNLDGVKGTEEDVQAHMTKIMDQLVFIGLESTQVAMIPVNIGVTRLEKVL